MPFLNEKRLRMYPIALLFGGALGFLITVMSADGLKSAAGSRIGGDFPSFYGAGTIVLQGHARSLYDGATQLQAQAPYLIDAPGSWIHFPYPPFVALLYVPFAWLPFKAAYLLHVVLMALCGAGALYLLRAVPAIDRRFPVAVVATLTTYPMLIAVTGGQNAALSLLCVAGAAAALRRTKDVEAGLWLAAWCFKPQFALTALAIIAVRRPRVLIGAAGGALCLYAAGAIVGGWSWPLWWWREGVQPFAAADLSVDRGNGVSFREWSAESGMVPIGSVLSAVATAWALWRGRATSPLLLTGLAASTALLIAPHALYYDAGIASIAAIGLVGVNALPPRSIALLWGATFLQLFRALLPVPPLTIVLALMAFQSGWRSENTAK